MHARAAEPADISAITTIYNQGIEDRTATFETDLLQPEHIARWLESGLPVVVVESEGLTVGFAVAFPYRKRACYVGVREFYVFVERGWRGVGVGRCALEALETAAVRDGAWKLVSRVFVESSASRSLLKSGGFREVGTYRRHAQLDGEWRDVIIVEKWIGAPQP